jgi:hypothetical protein
VFSSATFRDNQIVLISRKAAKAQRGLFVEFASGSGVSITGKNVASSHPQLPERQSSELSQRLQKKNFVLFVFCVAKLKYAYQVASTVLPPKQSEFGE